MKKRIAIIGSGIAGLTTAYFLSRKHDVVVLEKNNYIGGHTATIDVPVGQELLAIDTGFIVFNDRTYPNFNRLLHEIGVKRQATEMSFSVHNCETGLEYNGHSLRTLFAQKRNILRPKFWRLIAEIVRFNRLCHAAYQHRNYANDLTLGQFLATQGFSDFFAEHYVLPMGAAIWSTSLDEMALFQFRFFVNFFYNHGLLNISDRPQWYVIPGGSRNYIAPLTKHYADKIKLNVSVESVERRADAVVISYRQAEGELVVDQFDDVVFACHSDQALALLSDASASEQTILSQLPYSANDVVLHTDIRLLPKRKAAWASWNYQLSQHRDRPASVTYNMNILQGLKHDTTFCVTLNQTNAIDPKKIIAQFSYHHPAFSVSAMQAQQQRSKICGQNRSHFVGAYWYNGFHEDGVRSALDVVQRFGCGWSHS